MGGYFITDMSITVIMSTFRMKTLVLIREDLFAIRNLYPNEKNVYNQ